jgi:hypothetical protein
MRGREILRSGLKGALTVAAALLIAGCGGGTAGTGTGERSIEGQVLTADQRPLEGATVTVIETGDSSVTDAAGNFTISSPAEESVVDLSIDKGDDVHVTVGVDAGSDPAAAVHVSVTVSPASPHPVSVEALQVTAKIVGFCDAFFENNRVIRQSVRIPNGTQCDAQVTIYGDGRLLERIPFVVQRSRCGHE